MGRFRPHSGDCINTIKARKMRENFKVSSAAHFSVTNILRSYVINYKIERRKVCAREIPPWTRRENFRCTPISKSRRSFKLLRLCFQQFLEIHLSIYRRFKLFNQLCANTLKCKLKSELSEVIRKLEILRFFSKYLKVSTKRQLSFLFILIHF